MLCREKRIFLNEKCIVVGFREKAQKTLGRDGFIGLLRRIRRFGSFSIRRVHSRLAEEKLRMLVHNIAIHTRWTQSPVREVMMIEVIFGRV